MRKRSTPKPESKEYKKKATHLLDFLQAVSEAWLLRRARRHKVVDNTLVQARTAPQRGHHT